MHIVAIAWIYVVLMMSITERSVVAGVMTFLLYGVVPLAVILYVMGAAGRKRRRIKAENAAHATGLRTETIAPGEDKNDRNAD